MSRDLFILPKAAQDLDEIMSYYKREGGDALADRFAEAFFDSASRLINFPNSGVARETSQSALRELRSILVDGFPTILIFYRSTSESIDVARVVHGSRDLGREFMD